MAVARSPLQPSPLLLSRLSHRLHPRIRSLPTNLGSYLLTNISLPRQPSPLEQRPGTDPYHYRVKQIQGLVKSVESRRDFEVCGCRALARHAACTYSNRHDTSNSTRKDKHDDKPASRAPALSTHLFNHKGARSPLQACLQTFLGAPSPHSPPRQTSPNQHSTMSNEISIPTLVVVCVIGGLVFKYLFWPSASGGGSSGAQGGGRDSASQQRQRELAVERIQQMFPQVERRTILWDLQRNGGSIAATTEKILSGTIQLVSSGVVCVVVIIITGGLLVVLLKRQRFECKRLMTPVSQPPITFQPPPPPGSNAASSSASAAATGAKPADKPAQPNLIQRYNLQDKLQAQAEAEEEAAKKWSSNKDERQALLQRRRDEMILQARRKMEAKLAADKAEKAA